VRAVDYGLFDSANHYNKAGDAFTRRTTAENGERATR
jgi:hypothetical protein